jgi:SecD/SecF fusion protein
MSDYFDRVERQIMRRVESGVRRPAWMPTAFRHLGTAIAVLVVIAVAGVFLLARGVAPTPTGPAKPAPPAHGLTVSLAPETLPGNRNGIANGAIRRTIQILRARLHQAVPGAQVAWTGADFTVRVPDPSRNARAQILTLAAPGRLAFYDWEASVFTPAGKTVASQLGAQDPTALTISQGSGGAGPGDQGAGCLSLNAALALAAREPASQLPTLVEATGHLTGSPPGAQDPTAGYYVLRGAPALSGSQITDPQPGKDPNTGAPDVTFGFTASGARRFKALTAAIARRGSLISSVGESLDQHFAIVLDNKLISVPYVDYKVYPAGVSAGNGAEITGSFTVEAARDIAILLRYGPLPISLSLKAAG